MASGGLWLIAKLVPAGCKAGNIWLLLQLHLAASGCCWLVASGCIWLVASGWIWLLHLAAASSCCVWLLHLAVASGCCR